MLAKDFINIYGEPGVVVETDHKPLVSTMKKPLSDCPIRIQRLLLRLQKYSIDLTYLPGQFLYDSDALSRAYVNDIDGEQEMEVYVDTVRSNLQVSDEKLENIKIETNRDEQLQKLKDFILQVFPHDKNSCPSEITEYWNIRDELSLSNGLILKGGKIIIPRTLRKEMLQKKIRAGHLGIEKMSQKSSRGHVLAGDVSDYYRYGQIMLDMFETSAKATISTSEYASCYKIATGESWSGFVFIGW